MPNERRVSRGITTITKATYLATVKHSGSQLPQIGTSADHEKENHENAREIEDG